MRKQGHYRSRDDIILELLENIKSTPSIRRTNLMYKVFLSHYQLKKFLDDLVTKELVQVVSTGKNNDGQGYVLTQKGLSVWKAMVDINNFMQRD